MIRFVLVILGLLVIGYLIYSFALPKPANPSNSATVTASSTSSAATTSYSNPTYGFAFDYPIADGTSTLSFAGKDVHDPTDPNVRFDGTLSPKGFTVEVDAKPANFSTTFFSDQFTVEKREGANRGLTLSTTTVSVGGTPSFAVIGVGNGKTEHEILIAHGNYIYSLGYTLPTGEHDATIDTVLSSFRFAQAP